MSYYSSRYTSAPKPIIRDARYESQYDSHHGSRHASRESSTDSRASYYSHSSLDYPAKRRIVCSGSAEQRAYDEWQRKHRVPDNRESLFISSNHPSYSSFTDDYQISSSGKGKVDIVGHKAARHDAAEPRSSDATSTHYKASQHRSSKSSGPRKH